MATEAVRQWVCKRTPEGGLELIPVGQYTPESNKTSYQVLQDTIPDTFHPVTGEMCSSRTGMIKKAKAHGLEEWSTGTRPYQYKPDRKDIRERMNHFYEQSRYRSR